MMNRASNVRIALSTAASRKEAEKIAHALVEERLAACVNLVPGLTSVYRWQGRIEAAEEILLVIKTTAECAAAAEAALRRLHSYEVPEFLVLAPEAGSDGYMEWLMQSVSAPVRTTEQA